MSAKIRHIAIVSDQYALEGRFYEAVFGMRTAADTRPERAVTVSDGYVGLNINPRKAGRPGDSTTSVWKWKTRNGSARSCGSATPPSKS